MKTLVNLSLLGLILLSLIACSKNAKQVKPTAIPPTIILPTPRSISVVLPIKEENNISADTTDLPSMNDLQLGGDTLAEDAGFAPALAYVRYNNIQWGISFRYPAEWYVDEQLGRLVVSPSANASDLFQDGVGSVIVFFPKEAGMTAESSLNSVRGDLADLVNISEPQVIIEIDGSQGIYASTKRYFPKMQVDKRITNIVVETDTVFVAFLGIVTLAEVEVYQPMLEAIAFSAEFSQPSSEFLTQYLTDGQNGNAAVTAALGEEVFNSEKMGIAFSYPSDWSVVETRDEITISKSIVNTLQASHEIKQLIISQLPQLNGGSLEQRFATISGNMLAQENIAVIDELHELMLNGNQGLQIDLDITDQQVAFTLTLAEYDGLFFLFTSFLKTEDRNVYQPIFNVIMDSIEFSQPAIESLTLLDK